MSDTPLTDKEFTRLFHSVRDDDYVNAAWLEICNLERQLTAANARVKELEARLQFDPGGGDKIDELESAMNLLRHELRTAKADSFEEAAKICHRSKDFVSGAEIMIESIAARRGEAAAIRKGREEG